MVKATLANLAWLTASAPAYMAFSQALENPAREQEKLLSRYLQGAAGTAFGKEHGLSEIRSHEQFARRVPIRDYDELQPWIDRIRQGEQRVLTSEPTQRLVPTSGSTAARKLIPYTRESQRELSRAIGPWICDLYRYSPRALRGPAYWSVTPTAQDTSGVQPSKLPIGFDDDSAYLGGWFKWAIDAAMAVPDDLKHIGSIDVLRYVTLLLLLRCRDLSLMSVWHPSFLELLFAALAGHWDRLVQDVASGGCAVIEDVPNTLHACVQARPNPDRARELRATGPNNLPRLWPMLALISCWGDGHAASAAAALSAILPTVAIQPKGLLATEGVISIPFEGQHPVAIRSHFFEFVDEKGNVTLASDLQPEHHYSVVLTTAGGLCRYRFNDLIQVTGTIGRTPSIRFIGKAGLISDRMGEKLSDGFVTGVLSRLFAKHPSKSSFAMLAPEHDAKGWRYTLYVNSRLSQDLGALLDEHLQENPHYAYCRKLGQLRRASIFHITVEAYATYCNRLCSLGQRLGDVKAASLSPLDDWSRHFSHGDINARVDIS